MTTETRTAIRAILAITLSVMVEVRVLAQSSANLTTPAPQADAADWPTYNHDVAGWRFNRAETTLNPENVGSLVEKWRFPAADSGALIGVVHATPAVVAGQVYFGTATFPAFYKLGSDGKQLWVYRNPTRKAVLPPTDGAPVSDKLRGAASEAGFLCSALVADGLVYFADTGGMMYCLDAATGQEKWKVDARAPEFPGAHWNNMFFASPILADGKVIFGGGTLEQLFAGTKTYPGSTGRGFVVAVEPKLGAVVWKHDVGPKPEKLDPPVVVENDWGKFTFESGPATSSVWSTPTYDAESNRLFFGTDVNTAPRRPTPENPSLTTDDSCAVVCLDAATGHRRWNTQLNPGDLWINSMRAYDPKTGVYNDGSIGDSPKVITVLLDGKPTKMVGVGCKNGGFYLLRADDGKLVKHTPLYTGKPVHPPETHDPRVLALPSPIGGLQTGCATDGTAIYTNGIDAIRLGTQASPRAPGQVPTGGRVTATSVDLSTELWRHERPTIAAIGGTPEEPMYRNVGDIVGSGIAVGNGVAYFTTVGSGKLIAVSTQTGKVLKEIELGPVFTGPSLSRGRVYVGGGNTLWNASEFESYFPKRYTGSVRCFGLPELAQQPAPEPFTPEQAREEYAYTIGVQAYIYGYPLVEMFRIRFNAVFDPDNKNRVPLNQFRHRRELLDHTATTVVAPNNDTLYSSAWLDLAREPLVLDVPDTKGRYYVMQFMDFYTNNFAYVGKRTTGTGPGSFAVVGPGWNGTLPGGLTRVQAPTNAVWLLGRTLVDSKDDLSAAHAVQDQYLLTPLSRWGTKDEPKLGSETSHLPPYDLSEPLKFFELLSVALRENPPPAREESLMSLFGQVGVGPGKTFTIADLDPATARGLRKAIDTGRRLISALPSGRPVRNGWLAFSPHTGKFGDDYRYRAYVAMSAIAANDPAEAYNFSARQDDRGQPLNGDRKYLVRFEKGQVPPVDAFWSLTLYRLPGVFFVENALGRYALGDRSRQLRYEADGSLEIYVQHDSPGKDKESNWLPAAKGDFSLALRCYLPRKAIVDGSWKPPTVKPVE